MDVCALIARTLPEVALRQVGIASSPDIPDLLQRLGDRLDWFESHHRDLDIDDRLLIQFRWTKSPLLVMIAAMREIPRPVGPRAGERTIDGPQALGNVSEITASLEAKGIVSKGSNCLSGSCYIIPEFYAKLKRALPFWVERKVANSFIAFVDCDIVSLVRRPSALSQICA